MIFSVTIGLLLCSYFCQTGALSVEKIEDEEFDVARNPQRERFNVHISEKGVKFDQKVTIDKKNKVEYFKAPAHNNNQESDYMYDFNMKIAVRRIKKDRVCYISPLPDDLPRPEALSKGLKSFARKWPSHKIEKVKKNWSVGPKVDKSTLSKKARDFCGNFNVFRLVPFSLDMVSVGKGGKTKRQVTNWALCDKNNIPGTCNPDQWTLTCRVQDQTCVYYLYGCNLNRRAKHMNCNFHHRYSSMVCCNPACPSG